MRWPVNKCKNIDPKIDMPIFCTKILIFLLWKSVDSNVYIYIYIYVKVWESISKSTFTERERERERKRKRERESISTILNCLMLNPLYTYRSYIYIRFVNTFYW